MHTDKIFMHAGLLIGACGTSLASLILEVSAH